jgi:catechol 2,3-dioxygenase-like lactoylglutathione lyase family enzyme
MSHVRRFDHFGITVADLDKVTAFFVGLGLEVEGTRMSIEGEFDRYVLDGETAMYVGLCLAT